MKFDHMCIMVSDLDRAFKLWRDVFGFQIVHHKMAPDGVLINQETLDDVFKVKGAKSDTAILVHPGGAMMELQQVVVPKMIKTPREVLSGYDYTGFQELGLLVTDIEQWFEKVRAAGYKTQTEYVWPVGQFGKTFLFYDDDGNLIQLREGMVPTV